METKRLSLLHMASSFDFIWKDKHFSKISVTIPIPRWYRLFITSLVVFNPIEKSGDNGLSKNCDSVSKVQNYRDTCPIKSAKEYKVKQLWVSVKVEFLRDSTNFLRCKKSIWVEKSRV